MKKYLARAGVMATGLFILMLTGLPLQSGSIDFIGPAYGMGHRPPPHHEPGPTPSPVPEPSTLALIGVGIVGVGVYFYKKKKNHK